MIVDARTVRRVCDADADLIGWTEEREEIEVRMIAGTATLAWIGSPAPEDDSPALGAPWWADR